MKRLVFLGLSMALIARIVTAGNGYDIITVSGVAYGPGAMPATPFTTGHFYHIALDKRLAGESTFFNNGPEAPNHSGELKIFGKNQGRLSNGVPFNENMDGGIVNIGQGALYMLATVPADGPSKGLERYWVDERLNWRWKTDLALDPGFPQGLVVTKNINITTGVLWIPPSIQTETGTPGGFDQAGGIPAGAPLFGRIGDRDEDGFLDGRMAGVSRVPLDFLFVPGAPLAMTRTIVSNIPLAPRASGLLELASICNFAEILKPAHGSLVPGSALEKYYIRMLPEWAAEFAERANHAAQRLAQITVPEAALARTIADDLGAALHAKADLPTYTKQVEGPLARLEAALPTLRAAFNAP